MRNFDYPMPNQGWAAKQMLWQVQQDAAALYAALRNDDRLPAWTLQKLAQGGDRIGVAARYLLYKINENTPSYGYGADAAVAKQAAPTNRAALWVAIALGAAMVYGIHTTMGGFSGPPRRVRKNPAEPRVWSEVEQGPDGTWTWFARIEYPAAERRRAVRGGPSMGYATKAKAQAALDAFLARELG